MNPIIEHYGLVLAALCVWREARGESRLAKWAVAQVIFARVDDPRWPNTAEGVVLQKDQFSSFNPKDPNSWKFPTPDDQSWRECCDLVLESADRTGGGSRIDPSGGANHYHSLPVGQEPSWADPAKLTATIGAFRFFKL